MSFLHSFRMFLFISAMLLLHSCNEAPDKKLPPNFKYSQFKDSLKTEKYDTTGDDSNIFDSTMYNPATDTLNELLIQVDTLLHQDIASMEQLDTLRKIWAKAEKYSPEELEAIKSNIKEIDSFLTTYKTDDIKACKEKGCLVYAQIVKSTQTLYLYLDDVLIDSFAVSTGVKNFETPEMNRRVSGPVLRKYTSRKYPGGNYKGLGNMPYAVFIRGGYAIHGTTRGNFVKLGNPASHGCIRLHPLDAKVFYNLVKLFGVNNTWVSIVDSLP